MGEPEVSVAGEAHPRATRWVRAWPWALDVIRIADPGRVRLRVALRTLAASVAALLVSGAVREAADVPSGGVVVIATVVAVMVSRTLHATSLAHRLSALLYVPAIGIVAAFTGRVLLSNAWLGAAAFVAAVGGSRYLMRFGGKVRRFGRLALTPLISVLVVPVPPSAAKATGPLWGGVAGLIAVACVIVAQYVPPVRPAKEAAAAARDLAALVRRLRALPPGSRSRARLARALHRTALAAEDRLAAVRLPDPGGSADSHEAGTDAARLDALAAAVLAAEVAADPLLTGDGTGTGTPAAEAALDLALADLGDRAARAAGIRAGEWPKADPPAPRRRTGGLLDLQPQTRLAAQLTASMAAGFLVGHLLFGQRWMWTVITAFVVCSAARGRGDVVHRSGLRVAGAFSGALTGTLLAHLVAGDQVVSIAVIFGYLLIGLWLRDLNYAIWAFCVTSLLAVLHTLSGEHGTALLVQRPEGILLGSACGIAAAYFVLPVRTELVMRGRAARALQALQELMSAAREPLPRPTALRQLARRVDFATRDLADASAAARAHRTLVHRGTTARRAPENVRPHAADWADTLAACARHARALAATDPAALAAARPQLGLTALNVGNVRRRLGHRPEAAPPRPARTGPPPLLRLNSSLTELYDRLPAPPSPSDAAPDTGPPSEPGIAPAAPVPGAG
ncbi:FUSC family protein [Actinacidiphila alni]|uniref:FUSC family protein n=1 Tax=Actinacidiphila alni TaxID=380248 RepID=UPI0034518427